MTHDELPEHVRERGFAILELFSEAQERAQLTDRKLRLEEKTRQKNLEIARKHKANPKRRESERRRKRIASMSPEQIARKREREREYDKTRRNRKVAA